MTLERPRLPPQNLEAEASVMRAILLDNNTLDDVLGEAAVKDFYSHANRIIVDATVNLIRDNKPATPLTVAEELERLGQLSEVGGWERLLELLNSVPTEVAHVRYHARLIREAAQRRRIIEKASAEISAAHDHVEINELLAMRDRGTQEISNREQARVCVTMHEALLKRRDMHQKGAVPRTPTPWSELNDLLGGGVRNGSVNILAARTSVGKTVAATNIGLHVAELGHAVLFVALEQSQIEITNRLLSSKSGLPFADIEADRLTDALDRERLADTENELARLPMRVIDEGSLRLSQIAATARAERRHGLQLLILDYLQLVRPDDDRVHREQQVAGLSRGLKYLARDLDIAILCLAQLNRAIEGRDRKQPRLSDLRESGSIEQDADTVMFLDRPATYDPDANSSEASIIVAKNRNGPCGKVPLHWDGSTMTYRSAATSWEAAASASNWFAPPTTKPTDSAIRLGARTL